MLKHSIRVSFLILGFIISGRILVAQISFPVQSDYFFLKGSDATTLENTWMQPEFDASSWESGPAPFWYDDGSDGTLLADMRYSYSTVYLRSGFTAANADRIKTIIISADYDDGFILWINGQQALSVNAPSDPAFDSFSISDHESGIAVNFALDSSEIALEEGINTVAVQLFNVTLSSSDIHFDMSITAMPDLPPLDTTAGRVLFSHDPGFYDSPFDLTLSSSGSGTIVIYTLDGSLPGYSASTVYGDSSISLLIDPESTSGRPATAGVIVRAALYREGFAPSVSRSATYLFVDRVRNQSWPGEPWPSYNVNGQVIDLSMDPDVVSDTRYTSLIEDALLDIPSYSVITDNDNMFSSSSGIYVNASNHGEEWERECSVEMLDPEGAYFQINAGIRIRGGASRGAWNPKHAFRLFFREAYGDAKLNYPLFGDEGVAVFNKIDLRTEQNYSWSKDGDPAGALNTFIKDIYSRRLQGELGQPYTRSRYCHLYINGLYWGLFMTEERPEADYAETYFGDDQEDYDVIKVATETWPYFNEATDGNMDAWTELWNLCRTGFSSNQNYFGLEGKDASGLPVKGSKVMVDIDNLIDYMAIIFYTGNFDAPVSAWYGNGMPNNFYAIYNRKNLGTGFIFVGHDNEHSMMVDPLYASVGVNDNRVSLPDMSATGPLDFQPQWLHYKLCSNAEYRLRFADRAASYFNEGGIFCPDTSKAQFMRYQEQLTLAIIGESARWGDAQRSVPYTKDDSWLPALEKLYSNFFPVRADIVEAQLKTADLLPDILAPSFNLNSVKESREYVQLNSNSILKIINNDPLGELVYTTDGTDPRQTGGDSSPTARTTDTDPEISIDRTTIIKARARSGSSWSALSKIILLSSEEDYTGLRITELHYHPADLIEGSDTIDGDDQEFIELKNTGTETINLSGITFDSAIYFSVPQRTLLAPGQFYVIASKPEVFYHVYGMNPDGNYDRHLGNSGELLLITDPQGQDLFRFTYNDKAPWPEEADGGGFSLTSYDPDPEGDPGSSSYWISSSVTGGSPYADDPSTGADDRTKGFDNKILCLITPNPAREYFTVQSDQEEQTEIRIIDGRGILHYENSFSGSVTISCEELGSKGVYIVLLRNSYGIANQKVIVL